MHFNVSFITLSMIVDTNMLSSRHCKHFEQVEFRADRTSRRRQRFSCGQQAIQFNLLIELFEEAINEMTKDLSTTVSFVVDRVDREKSFSSTVARLQPEPTYPIFLVYKNKLVSDLSTTLLTQFSWITRLPRKNSNRVLRIYCIILTHPEARTQLM